MPVRYEEGDDPKVWLLNLNNGERKRNLFFNTWAESTDNFTFCEFEGIYAGYKLGVKPLLKADDLADNNVEHLRVMAYVASFLSILPYTRRSSTLTLPYKSRTARVYKPVEKRDAIFLTHYQGELI